MRFWFDTEFIEDGKTIDLISIGVVSDDPLWGGYYAEVAECDHSRASQWVKDNVLGHLQGGAAVKPRHVIASDLIEVFGSKPQLWAYYGAYDWVALCQIYGTMMQLPKGWPMYVRDVKQLCDMLGNPTLPAQGKGEHHALADATWTRQAWNFLHAEWERQHNESPKL